jgi:hypothetical protein
MAIKNFFDGTKQMFDNAGDPLDGGLCYFYEPGTSTAKDTYTTSDLSTANANPVVLDANGRANVWLNGNYKVIVKDSDGNTIYTEDNINPEQQSSFDDSNKAFNGSFEDAPSLASQIALGWDFTETSVIDRVDGVSASGNSYHGRYGIKFTKTAGTAAGSIQNADEYLFPVDPFITTFMQFAYYSSAAGVDNKVQVIWYTADGSTVVQTDDVYDDSSEDSPTSWKYVTLAFNAPSTARWGRAKFTFAMSGGDDGSSYLDNVNIFQSAEPVLVGAGTVATTGATYGGTHSGRDYNVTYLTAAAFSGTHFDIEVRRGATGTYQIQPPNGLAVSRCMCVAQVVDPLSGGGVNCDTAGVEGGATFFTVNTVAASAGSPVENDAAFSFRVYAI